jgi:hypothetical protein
VAGLASALDGRPAAVHREQERLEVDAPAKPARKGSTSTARSQAKKKAS